MSLEFLSPARSALARSPMEREARAAGARIEERDGWNVALGFDGEESERRRCDSAVGFVDRSHLGKIELQAGPADLARLVAAGSGGETLELGRATKADGAWWCRYTPTRAIVLCEPADTATLRARLELAAAESAGPVSVIDVTTVFAALTVIGPLAGEVFARFSAVDLRPTVMPVHGFKPVSVARTPGTVLCEAEQRYLMLFGAALGSYMWTVVADAAENLGGGPVGLEALADA